MISAFFVVVIKNIEDVLQGIDFTPKDSEEKNS
jgi:hypothetical protein